MATQNKIIEMIAAIKTIYSYYAKETDVQMLVKTWTVLLKDYPDDIVETAFYKCLQTCKMPPTPADVIERIEEIARANAPSNEELWSQYTKALDRVRPEVGENGYINCPLFGQTSADAHKRIEAIWERLPESLKDYIGSKGELMRMARDYSDQDIKFERTRFFKTLPTIQKRQETAKLQLSIGDNKLKLGG